MAKVTAIPFKEVAPGWLGKEETPSSQIPVLEAQEDQPRRQQPFPFELGARGAAGCGLPWS